MADETEKKLPADDTDRETGKKAGKSESADVTPRTGEVGGPEGPEPTRYGDWEKKGRCIDF